MMAQNKIVQKFVSALIIVAILAPAFFVHSLLPKKAEAQFLVSDPITEVNTGITAAATSSEAGMTWKDVLIEVARQFVMTVIRKLLDKMTQSTINWINNGFHGNPLYLLNSDSFFKDIAKLEVRNLVNLFGYDSLKYPFGKDFSLNMIDAYRRQLAENAQYSLSKVIFDDNYLNNYRNNFNVGGWNGFLINTQYPQNNYLGFQMMANTELARRLQGTTQNAAQKVQTTLQQGLGFLSPQTCPSNPNYPIATNPYNPPSYKDMPFDGPDVSTTYDPDNINADSSGNVQDPEAKARFDQYKANWEMTNKVNRENFDAKYDCPGGLVNTTPGSLVGSQIGVALGSKIHQAELGAAVGNSLSAIFDALINHFLDKGLNSLTNLINPPPDNSTLENFSYFGTSINSAPPGGGDGVHTPTFPPPDSGVNNGGDGFPGQTCNDLPNIMSCSAPDHTALVQQVKDYVVSRGISLIGSCGAFEITKRVAWALRGEGAGLLTTTHTGQCNGLASGNLAYTDDSEVDILRDEGGSNTPLWAAGPGNTETTVHYQAPTDPGDPPGSYPISPTSTTSPGGTGPVVITGANDAINLHDAQIVSAPTDVASWPVTTTINSVTLNPGLSVDFSKKDGASRWPDQFGGPGVSPTDTIQYTVWFFTQINGQWVGSAFIQSWFGRNPLTGDPVTGAFAMQNLWYSSAWSPMFGHNSSGEQVGIMVTSGNSRLGGVPEIKERSNFVIFTMP